MRWLFFVVPLFHLSTSSAQNRVFLKASDLSDKLSGKNIQKIKLPWGRLGKSILVIYKDGTKTHVRKRSIWGFEKGDKTVLRFYDGETYQVVETGTIVIYKTYSPHPVYYFSERLDSKVILVSRQKMIKTLDTDTLVKAYKKSRLVRLLLYYN